MSIATVKTQIASAFKTVGIKGVLRSSITYTPKATGTPSTFTAGVSPDPNSLQDYEEGEGTEKRIQVTIHTDDVSAPVKFDKVTWNGEDYAVDSPPVFLEMFSSHRCTCVRTQLHEARATTQRVSR